MTVTLCTRRKLGKGWSGKVLGGWYPGRSKTLRATGKNKKGLASFLARCDLCQAFTSDDQELGHHDINTPARTERIKDWESPVTLVQRLEAQTHWSCQISVAIPVIRALKMTITFPAAFSHFLQKSGKTWSRQRGQDWVGPGRRNVTHACSPWPVLLWEYLTLTSVSIRSYSCYHYINVSLSLSPPLSLKKKKSINILCF